MLCAVPMWPCTFPEAEAQSPNPRPHPILIFSVRLPIGKRVCPASMLRPTEPRTWIKGFFSRTSFQRFQQLAALQCSVLGSTEAASEAVGAAIGPTQAARTMKR